VAADGANPSTWPPPSRHARARVDMAVVFPAPAGGIASCSRVPEVRMARTKAACPASKASRWRLPLAAPAPVPASAAHRSPIAYSVAAIAESVAALGRIDNFTERATERVGSRPTEVPKEFIDAMNDDLGASAALAVLHNAVHEGNQALAAGDSDQIARRLGEVNGMLMILGLNSARLGRPTTIS
jgi:hypothetical protein